MDHGTGRTGTGGPRLIELQIADHPGAWTTAGFFVTDEVVHLSGVRLRLVGRSADGGGGGITGWTIDGVDVTAGLLDGLPTADGGSDEGASTNGAASSTTEAHPNGVTGLDHVVVATPDLDRTIDACAAAGLDLRRIRDTTSNGAPMRQAFFRLGPTVLEVVSGDLGRGLPAIDAPATWFGIAVDVDDLDQTAAQLGDGLGRIKAAVQPGRRIATFRHEHFGLSVPVAAMDHHGDR